MKILVVAPSGAEYYQIQDVLNSRLDAGIQLRHEYEVLETGIGKVRVASALTKRLVEGEPVDLIVVTGFAAGSTNFKLGDFVCPNKALYHDVIVPESFSGLAQEFELAGEDNVTILTGDSFVEKDLAEKLSGIYGKDSLFDMEAAAVCQTLNCLEINLPVRVMKLVSDIPESDEHNENTYYKFVDEHPDGSIFIDKLESID